MPSICRGMSANDPHVIQKKPRQVAGPRNERGVLEFDTGQPLGCPVRYSSSVRMSASSSLRRLVKRAAAAPLITRWS